MNVRKIVPLFLTVVMLAALAATSVHAQPPSGVKAQATAAGTMQASDNPYLASLNKRLGETYDTAKFKKNGPYKIALASQGPTNSWATLFDAHARWRVAQLGKDVVSELLYADANGSADKQVPQVEDLLSQNPDVLILVPMGSAALSAPVERVMAAGVPVVLCASTVDTDNFVTEVGTNLYRRGQADAEWLVQQLGGKGNIVQMDGIAGVSTAEIGKAGAKDVWAKNPNIKVLDAQYGNWSTAEAKKLMEQWIAKYGKDINGIWANGAQMAMGIMSAYLDAKLPIPPIAGGEYFNGFLRMASENKLPFHATQYPPSMSVLCVDTAIKVLKGEPVKRFIDFRETIKEADDFTDKDISKYFNPKWSDDVFGPVFLPDEELDKLGYLKK
ncbi:MAG: substrate-binding domain-containing protein [Anaerolineae bacterium]|nr:substrate-binding domain-containing protein [Anaerolineae bacterium]